MDKPPDEVKDDSAHIEDNEERDKSQDQGLVYYVGGEKRIYEPGGKLERRMLLKVDLRMFTTTCTMYLLNYLDRTNIGNAKIAGLQEDLGLSSSDYSLALLIFFVGYLIFQIPSNLVLSRVKPGRYLPTITFIWGMIATLVSTVQSKTGLIVIRFFLGCVESGFFAGVLFLLGSWYRKHELARRMAYLYAAAILSGAFGGLLAGGVISGLEGVHGIRGWRWLFIIEGSITMFVSIICFFILPNWPRNTPWLSEEEKALAEVRMRADLVGVRQGATKMRPAQSVVAALSDWRLYLLTFMYTMDVGAGTITYFIPTLTQNLGYKGNSAQYMTIPVYGVTLVFSLAIAWSSDYFQEKPLHVVVPMFFAGLFYILSIPVTNRTAQYVFLCFGFGGTWGALPIILALVPFGIPYPDEKRGVSQAFVNMVANLSSIYGSYLWPSSDAPGYHTGLATTSSFCFACCISAIIAKIVLRRYPYTFDFDRWEAEPTAEPTASPTPNGLAGQQAEAEKIEEGKGPRVEHV